MTLLDNKIIDIFYLIDEFCHHFEKNISGHILGNKPKRKPKMNNNEVITLMVLSHFGCSKNFKHFYLHYVRLHLNHLFPNTISYNRFVELMQSAALPMTIFLKSPCPGNGTGISFIESTPIRVCKNKHIKRNKVFRGIAALASPQWGIFMASSCT